MKKKFPNKDIKIIKITDRLEKLIERLEKISQLSDKKNFYIVLISVAMTSIITIVFSFLFEIINLDKGSLIFILIILVIIFFFLLKKAEDIASIKIPLLGTSSRMEYNIMWDLDTSRKILFNFIKNELKYKKLQIDQGTSKLTLTAYYPIINIPFIRNILILSDIIYITVKKIEEKKYNIKIETSSFRRKKIKNDLIKIKNKLESNKNNKSISIVI